MAEGASKQILLLAPELLGESLANQIKLPGQKVDVLLHIKGLTQNPSLVIWYLENVEVPIAIQNELRKLQDHWYPSPVLLLLPGELSLNTNELLQFNCPGLLQDPDLKTLNNSIKIVIEGGRVVRLKNQAQRVRSNPQPPMGLGQWLLLSGTQQIDNDLQRLKELREKQSPNILTLLLLNGRERELKTAKALISILWGPIRFSKQSLKQNSYSSIGKELATEASGRSKKYIFGTSIDLKEKSSQAVWLAIRKRLEETVETGLINSTGKLLAIEGINEARQVDLLKSLIKQLDNVLHKLSNFSEIDGSLNETWLSLQQELRQEALREMVGSYVRLPISGELIPVVEKLIDLCDLSTTDEELPNSNLILEPLLLSKPTLVDGQNLPPDDPRALIHIEMLLVNWLIRSAELISSEVIAACGLWPELRTYLLQSKLISTRELERLRNQLNSQNRWENLIQRPIQLYESKRLLFVLREGHIEPKFLTEPRDYELRQLGWWQQQVALLVEARDAIAPQLQTLVSRIGSLMVVLLTKVIGRSIGLIGRGIAQGMGRNLGRS